MKQAGEEGARKGRGEKSLQRACLRRREGGRAGRAGERADSGGGRVYAAHWAGGRRRQGEEGREKMAVGWGKNEGCVARQGYEGRAAERANSVGDTPSTFPAFSFCTRAACLDTFPLHRSFQRVLMKHP